jgi:nitrate reductase gamma subunit
MTSIALYCLLYAGVAVFLLGCMLRIVRYATAPVHLRWELYPIPQGKSGQLKVMIPEILFLRNLHESNRTMWLRSFPFHFGLYLLTVTAVLVFAAILPGTEPVRGYLHAIYRATGVAGLVLALAGALGLLSRRLIEKELRAFTTAGDLFNLFFFAVTLTLLLVDALSTIPGPGPADVLRGALRFDTSVRPSGFLTAGMMLGSLLLAYIPMTHMSHFIAKYFTYHAVRWDDHPNTRGRFDRRMAVYLGYRPTWSARHVGADGVRTWADIATTNPAKGGGK